MILVLVEHEGGVPARTSLEAATFARGLGGPIHGVAFGDGGAQALAAAGAYGVLTGTLVRTDGGFAPGAWAQALCDAVTAETSAVIAPGTDRGNEILAHLGAKTGAPFVANCIAAAPGSDGWALTRQRWGGSLLEDARAQGQLILLSVAPHAVAPEPGGGAASVTIDETEPAVTSEDLRVRAKWVEATEAGVSLADARLVVGGGRGVGGAAGFAVLDTLATALGGAVGVSRAVTSAGWRPHAEQIGQTGTRIAPELYIPCGISGASQHMVGCRGAKRLLTINTDPDAPILSKSDYAVIGDLHQVVPAIIAELKHRRG